MAVEILSAEGDDLERLFVQASFAEMRAFQQLNPGMMFHLVGFTGSLKIEIFSDEHPPPHFRVKFHQQTANFEIATCRRLNGNLERRDREVSLWWKLHRKVIAEEWNNHRPTNCPVGRIDVKTLNW